MEYKKCSEVSDDLIFSTFKEGFSDYIVQIPITKDQFFNRFFGPEGNSKEYSFIAFEENKGAGLILGGIDYFDNLKTLRCGTMCIVPSQRGTNIAMELFKRHQLIGAENKCKQLFLEVITTNSRAIKFYERQGYEKVYDLNYYSIDKTTFNRINKNDMYKNISIEKNISLNELKFFRNSFFQSHINWQNEMNYIQKSPSKILGIKERNEIVGVLAYSGPSIHFIGVRPKFRNKGFGTSLVLKAINESGTEKIKSSFPNNSNLKGFFEKIGFQKESLSQYEMYKTL